MRAPTPAFLARTTALLALTALAACGEAPRGSLVGDFAAPGAYALGGDTITVWKRMRQPDGSWRFHSYSITPGGTVEYLEELEQVGAPESGEDAKPVSEVRKGFALPPDAFAAIRAEAARLRPPSLGPDDAVGGYGGEVPPAGCALDKTRPRLAGVNFLNSANWGAFVLQQGCAGEAAGQATAAVSAMFDRLDRAARAAPARR